jgi:CDP-glycerol glycerophosphotransferase
VAPSLTRLPPAARVPGLRDLPARLERVRDDEVLFESWHGTYADNPRAISAELHRRRPDLRQVWVARDPSDVPAWATAVAPDGVGYLRHLARARHIVANNAMPRHFRKRPGTTYVQTWHGTPLKRIAFDIPRPAFRGGDRYLDGLRRDVAGWDHLVSPNRFSTEVFRRAFRYAGPVLETGYPRNDVLLAPDAERRRRAVRFALGIDEDQLAVLYAPTWRDDGAFTLELDLARVGHALGDRAVLLLRAHHLVAATVRAADLPRVTDVSSRPDIAELYLAADVLITDYSSVMFDFAVTGKPLLFYTYDLDRYRDELRGFYFDFEAQAPGPLLRDTEAVIAALEDLQTVRAASAERYAAFKERFCHLDDGRASARVVEAVFG